MIYFGYCIIVLLYLLRLFEDKECREFSKYISELVFIYLTLATLSSYPKSIICCKHTTKLTVISNNCLQGLPHDLNTDNNNLFCPTELKSKCPFVLTNCLFSGIKAINEKFILNLSCLGLLGVKVLDMVLEFVKHEYRFSNIISNIISNRYCCKDIYIYRMQDRRVFV